MRRIHRGHRFRLSAVFAVALASSASATEPESEPESEQEEDKAKKLAQDSQNPVSSLIQIPFQLNMAGSMGNFDRSQFILNIQPVIPIPLSKNWTLVPRLITPIVGMPDIMQAQGTWALATSIRRSTSRSSSPRDSRSGSGRRS